MKHPLAQTPLRRPISHISPADLPIFDSLEDCVKPTGLSHTSTEFAPTGGICVIMAVIQSRSNKHSIASIGSISSLYMNRQSMLFRELEILLDLTPRTFRFEPACPSTRAPRSDLPMGTSERHRSSRVTHLLLGLRHDPRRPLETRHFRLWHVSSAR